jgi:hypothetical protein
MNSEKEVLNLKVPVNIGVSEYIDIIIIINGRISCFNQNNLPIGQFFLFLDELNFWNR